MRRHRRPVVELSVTYEPALGVIEVVQPDRNKRDELAPLFADTVLGHSIEGQRIRLREYDLSRLLAPFDFPFDPAAGTESVELVLLRVQRLDSGGKRTTLEMPRRAPGSTWDYARDELRRGDLVASTGQGGGHAGPGAPTALSRDRWSEALGRRRMGPCSSCTPATNFRPWSSITPSGSTSGSRSATGTSNRHLISRRTLRLFRAEAAARWKAATAAA